MIADSFNNFFIESVSSIAQSFSPSVPNALSQQLLEPTFRLDSVTETEVSQVIQSLNPSRTKDIFGIDPFTLKQLAPTLTPPLTKIINQSISETVFPQIWKSAAVIPVYKNGDPFSLCNYWPISIIPTVSKVAEKLIAQQIITHLNTTPFTLHPMQFGFRARHSTETAICYFTENVKNMLDKGGVVGAVFLDLKKAFDTVNHKILLTKLSKFNFSSEAKQWLDSYLTYRSQSVRINDYISPSLPLKTGVPQGSNDLPSVCDNISIQMYADDTVIYAHGKDASQVADKLSRQLVNVTKWLDQSYLKLNVSKQFQCFSPGPVSQTNQQQFKWQVKIYKLCQNTNILELFWTQI